MSDGSWAVFVQHPIAAVFLGVAAFLVLLMVLPAVRAGRQVAFADEDQ